MHASGVCAPDAPLQSARRSAALAESLFWRREIVGLAVSLAGFALYAVNASSGAVPGVSVWHIVQHCGLAPFASVTTSVVWGALAQLLAGLPLGGVATRLNLFSAACGAASLWLLYRIVFSAVADVVAGHPGTRVARANTAASVAAAGSAVFLAVSLPFWSASNRAGPASFDVLLFLTAISAYYRFRRVRSRWALMVSAFLGGALVVEFPTFVLFVPLLGFDFLTRVWPRRHSRRALFRLCAFCFCAGLCLYFVAALNAVRAPALGTAGWGRYGRALLDAGRQHYAVFTQGVTREGWLLVMCFQVVPWLIAVRLGPRALNRKNVSRKSLALHGVLLALALLVLFNAKVTLLDLSGHQTSPVTPSVLSASTFGYVLAYACLLLRHLRERHPALVPASPGWLVGGMTLCVSAAAGLLAFDRADTRAARDVNAFARDVVGSLSGRQWLITDGVFDNHLMVASRDAAHPVRILNLRLGQESQYLQFAGSLFSDPRLRSRAQAGMLPLLHDWFGTDPDIERKAAVLALPDLWLACGKSPLPHGAVFLGTADPGSIDFDRLRTFHADFWSASVERMRRLAARPGPYREFGEYALRHMSRLANDLGVLLDERGQHEAAAGAYAKARAIDPGNVSALLNLGVLVNRGVRCPEAAAVQRDLADLASAGTGRVPVWSLSRRYGYVRSPESYAVAGWAWALSGYPGFAVSGMRKALDLAAGGSRQIQSGLAAVYLAQGQTDQGEEILRALVAQNPDDRRSLLSLARICALKGDFDQGRACLQRAERAGTPKATAALEWAVLHWVSGDAARARILIEELTDVRPDIGMAWAVLAGIAMQQSDRATTARCAKELQAVRTKDLAVWVALGEIATREHRLDTARQCFTEATRLNPSSRKLWEILIDIDMRERHSAAAEAHVRTLLTLDPDSAFANYVMGTLQIWEGRMDLAEPALRRSVARERTPAALNDLAWVLQQTGRLQEAEKLVREALGLDGRLRVAWDTLGVILRKSDRFDEAEQAFQRAIALSPDALDAPLHLAELHAVRGDLPQANRILDMVTKRQNALSPSERRELRDLRYRVARRLREAAPER